MVRLEEYEKKFQAFIAEEMSTDVAHDLSHVKRVVQSAKKLCEQEGAKSEVVIPAAWLHDCYTMPKDHTMRKMSSRIAAEKATELLLKIGYPKEYIKEIHHAISAHSFSADIKAKTIEAKIVQDADRLDSLGAVGVARCIQVSTSLGRPLYSDHDTLCAERMPDDSRFCVDHFYTKLFKLPELMKTESARQEAQKRAAFMQSFLSQLEQEVV